MLTTLLKWLMVAAVFGGLFWCSTSDCMVLLVAIWAVATGVFVYSNLTERFLWIPVLLALVGLFGSVSVLAIPGATTLLAIPGATTLAINEATLVTFIISIIALKKGRRRVALARH